MKLLLCLKCNDIFNLTTNEKSCGCGETSGKYIDDKNAQIKGDCKGIGFIRDNFMESYGMQQIEDKAQEGTETECEGVEFTAFFIPESADSIERI